ncbi:hypothetical protein [Methylobacterium sp. J-067]|uniref:hypothetical protein n=1 Tax=Methylobacterium sp. J-067 TaxID=2836648 RepID=UPI001FBBC6FF|nr:hypothetical protein [Methylobacterium sp. J-067]MCJ2024762.1 hypothetical protein [Methylobacterium sp. J-067]
MATGEHFGENAETIAYGIAALLADRAIEMRARTAARMTDELAAAIILKRRQAKATIARNAELARARADGERRRRLILAAAAGR